MKEGCDCFLTENYQSTFSNFHYRNVNKSKNQTIYRDSLSGISTENGKCFFVTRTKSLLPIHPLFLQTKEKGNPLEKLLFFIKKN